MNILQKAIRSMYSLTGSFNEKLLKYYKQYGATSPVLQDAEKQYLIGRLGAKYLTNQDYWKELDAQFGDGLPLEVSDILRKYGSDAHLYLPGIGRVNGFEAGNYFDSAGTTHASVDGSVGLVLDAAGSVGAELAGSTFSNSSGWSFSNGVLTATSAAAFSTSNNPGFLGMQVGKAYRITYNAVVTSGLFRCQFVGGSAQNGIQIASTGTYSEIFTPLETKTAFNAQAGSGGFTGTISLVAIKEITGIHATQSTPGFKPTLRKGIVNRITNSNQPATWGAANGASVTGLNLSLPNEYALVAVGQSAPAITSGPITIAFKLSGSGTCRILQDSGSGSVSLANVTLTDQPTIYVATFTASTGFSAIIGRWGGDTATAVLVEQGGIFAGTLTTQQILAAGGIPLTTTAPASSQAGVNYLEFDGVDDRLALNGPLFQMADDHCVVVGALAPANQASYRSIVNLSYGDSANYAAQILIEGGTGKAYVEWKGGGNVDALASPSSVIGTPFVFDVRKVGTTKYAALNGVDLGTRGAVTSATQATLANIGAETNNIPMKGNTYAVLAIKGTVSPTDLLVLRKFVAQLSGVTL